MTDLNNVLRPKSWEDVIGQDDVKEICRKTLAENKFPKFSIFYGPTGVGKSCIAELIAREITGYQGDLNESRCIQKYNMASLLGKSDIVSVIDNIFKFKAIADNVVFILEEVQVLRPKEEQSPFLEELTKIPDNVHIIMCTTKVTALNIELRNRAVLFQLGLPTFEECCSYVDSITYRLNFRPMSPKAKEVLIKASDYTPRSIVKHIELLASGDSVSEEDVSKFFKAISNMAYINLLTGLVDEKCTLFSFTLSLQKILKESHAPSLMYGFRNFMVELLLEKAAGTQEIPLTNDERKLTNVLLESINESRFIEIFEALSRVEKFKADTHKDVLAAFIKVKIMLMKKSVSEVISQNQQEAAASAVFSRQQARQLPRDVKPQASLKNVTTGTNLSAYGIENSTVFVEDDGDD